MKEFQFIETFAWNSVRPRHSGQVCPRLPCACLDDHLFQDDYMRKNKSSGQASGASPLPKGGHNKPRVRFSFFSVFLL